MQEEEASHQCYVDSTTGEKCKRVSNGCTTIAQETGWKEAS